MFRKLQPVFYSQEVEKLWLKGFIFKKSVFNVPDTEKA